ncbi:MAG: MBOAT family O-acyltransferase [Synergistales bacterium]|nr:MBOAT family O-acyltransferase [Synergistales bacterium]MDY6402120.1 MBOAT family O-acyltransferase [Synergistales bacterium]MDY6410622.1 MBOAT family O-acyltransferase [Synergistales bacterium]MDY6414462.1 MBOAT family O-acyltransferase [Synergistales bacterium]MDY6421880.1 MBOAT family O-acyltransferase [Synergistales bacterium]
MLFNSWQFGIFLPVVFAIYWAVPQKFRWALLFAASYYFYMSWNVEYVVLILFTTIISYFAAIFMERFQNNTAAKKIILTFTLVSCLGVLFVFKYFNFFSESFVNLMRAFSIQLHPMTLKLLLPVGISFYTFQTLSYVIDVYLGTVKPEKHFGIYATFISFFPQLVAGPIERTNNLLPQIKAHHEFNYEQATYGLKLMTWGFFKKLCIADNLALHVDKVFNDVYAYKGFALVLVTFFFTIQIYCDFSGYSDIARGAAKLFGINLMENFKSPYFSASIKEFWSRWHISLSTWFRDYVYIPLGGNRVSKARHYINLMITFIVSGLWHGANWTFIIWGSIHGLAQIIENIFTRRKNYQPRGLEWAFKVLLTFTFCMFAWVFFRAQSFSEAVYVFSNMFSGIGSLINYLHQGFVHIGMDRFLFASFCITFFVMLMFDYFSREIDVITTLNNKNQILRWFAYIAIGMIIIFLSQKGVATEFVYFQF